MSRAMPSFRKSSCERGRPRGGAVIIAALVCLAIVVAMLGVMLRAALLAQRQLHVERDRRQCELLLEAGLDRAALELAQQGEYRGETWRLPADAVLGTAEGQVTIAVARPADAQPSQISVTAEYPLGSEHSIRRSRTIWIDSQTSQSQE
jgi:hypothetical protein